MFSAQKSGAKSKNAAQSQSTIHHPFVSTRIFKRKDSPDGFQTSTLPGVEIPDKPQNIPKPGENRGEGIVRGPERKAKQSSTTNYGPSQIISMNDRALSVHTLSHELGKEVVGVRFATRIEIHALRLRTVENDEFFTMEKLQECVVKDDDLVEAVAIGYNSNIGYGAKKLTYAFSLFNRSAVYFVKDEPDTVFSFQPRIDFDNKNHIKCFNEHRTPVRTLAFDGENGKLLASLAKDPVCKIWDVVAGKLFGTLVLESTGVAVIFHKSESYKVLIAERNGWIKFYSLVTMSVVYSLSTNATPVLSADWSHLDPLIVGIGHFNCIQLINIAELNSEPSHIIDSYGANKMFKFSTTDRFIFAAVGKPKNDLRAFHTNMRTPLWSQRKEQIQWIEWVYGKPFLMACVGDCIQFYEASLY